MDLSVEDKALVVAARSGERGALRALAVSLEERLGDDDACLDGAVMAWRAVQGSRRRSGATTAAVAKYLIPLRQRLGGDGATPASDLDASAKRANLGPAVDRRPAA